MSKIEKLELPAPQGFSPNALAFRPEPSMWQRVQNPIESALAMGEMFAKSGMFGCTKVEQGQILALACLSENKSPFDIIKTYHIMATGKLEMKASAMLAKFIELGGKWKWTTSLSDREIQSAHIISPDGVNELDVAYTMDEAKQEGLTINKTYQKSAPDMLRARLISKTIRAVAPGINSGMHDRNEFVGEEPDEQKPLLQHAAKVETVTETAPTPPKGRKKKAEVIQPPAEPDPEPEPPVEDAQIEPADQDGANVDDADLPEDEDDVDQTPEPHVLDGIVGEHEKIVNEFLIAKGMVPEGQTYRSVSDAVKDKIITHAEAFIEQATDRSAW